MGAGAGRVGDVGQQVALVVVVGRDLAARVLGGLDVVGGVIGRLGAQVQPAGAGVLDLRDAVVGAVIGVGEAPVGFVEDICLGLGWGTLGVLGVGQADEVATAVIGVAGRHLRLLAGSGRAADLGDSPAELVVAVVGLEVAGRGRLGCPWARPA